MLFSLVVVQFTEALNGLLSLLLRLFRVNLLPINFAKGYGRIQLTNDATVPRYCAGESFVN